MGLSHRPTPAGHVRKNVAAEFAHPVRPWTPRRVSSNTRRLTPGLAWRFEPPFDSSWPEREMRLDRRRAIYISKTSTQIEHRDRRCAQVALAAPPVGFVSHITRPALDAWTATEPGVLFPTRRPPLATAELSSPITAPIRDVATLKRLATDQDRFQPARRDAIRSSAARKPYLATNTRGGHTTRRPEPRTDRMQLGPLASTGEPANTHEQRRFRAEALKPRW